MNKYKIYAAPRIVAQEIEIISDVWMPDHLIVIRNGGGMWVLDLDTRDLIRFTNPLSTDSDIKE